MGLIHYVELYLYPVTIFQCNFAWLLMQGRQVELSGSVNEKPEERFEVHNRRAAEPEQKTVVMKRQVEVQEGGASEGLVEVPERQVESLEVLSEASTQMVGTERQNKEIKTSRNVDQKIREVLFLTLLSFYNDKKETFLLGQSCNERVPIRKI